MSPAEQPLTPQEERQLETFCSALLTRDEPIEPVRDETVYAWLSGTATEEQLEKMDEALLASRSFCDEMLETADYIENLQSTLGAPGTKPRDAESPQERAPIINFFRWFRRPGLAAAAIVTVVAAVLLVQLVRWQTPASLPEAKHIAFLEIASADDDPVARAFCDGLVETATNKLSVLENFQESFWIVPAGTVIKKKVETPEDAGRKFGATIAVTGRLHQLADEYTLTLELVDVSPAKPRRLRSVEITEPAGKLAALQESITRRITEMLDIRLAPEAHAAIRAGDTDVKEAYQNYVQGRGYVLRYENVTNLDNAITAFENALQSDTTYALAHTGLAETFWRKYRASKDTEWIRRANDACLRALELDSTLAATHVMYGNVLNETGEYEQAITFFQRAQGIDSTVAGAANGLADAYGGLGRFEDAEATYLGAIRTKPDYWGGYNDLGYLYYTTGRFEEAAEQYRRISELTPDNYLAFSNLGVMYYYLERWPEAKEAFAASIDVQPSDRAYLNLASIYYIEADYTRAAELSERAIELNDSNYKTWATLANSRYWLPGSRERSFDAYRRAIELAEERLGVNPNDARLRVTLAGYYVMVDEREKARSYTEEALKDSSNKPFIVYFAGYVYEQLGERDTALELIGKAVELGYPIQEIERDPWLTDFRSDERFQKLLEEQE